RILFLISFVLSAALLAPAQPASSLAIPGTNGPAGTNLAPKIGFADTVFDFGKIEEGKVVKHEFQFTNTGDAPLEIADVQSSCGCTTAGDFVKHLDPGKSAVLPVLFNSARQFGFVAKRLQVLSNDPSQPNLMLQVQGTVWKVIDALPPIATFYFGPDFQTN